MHILINNLPRNYKFVLSILVIFPLILLNNSAIAGECYKRFYDCKESPQENHRDTRCPCFSSTSELERALGHNSSPNICRSSKAYSVLSGGTFTFTSEDYGNTFSCYVQNINGKTKKEVVEYGTQEEVLEMHLACDAIIKDFARANNIKCNK